MASRADAPSAPSPSEGYVRVAGRPGTAVASTVGYAGDSGAHLHRGLPSPYLTFIVSLAGPVVTGETAEHAWGEDAYRTVVLVGGLHRTPAYVRPDPAQAGLQLAVHPLAARALLGAPARSLGALVTDGLDVLGPDADRLRGQLVEEPDWGARFTLLEAYLRARLERGGARTRVRPELREAWRRLAASAGREPLVEVADKVSLSPRRLRDLFAAEVGVGPKQVARLMRFDATKQRIAATVAAGRPLDLSAIAYGAGYADLAHLDRDFAGFVGLSPSGWLAEERRNIQAGGHRHGPESDP